MMAYHAPFGTDETPSFYTKIIGSKPVDFVHCRSSDKARFYDNIDICSLPQYQYVNWNWYQRNGFNKHFGMMKNGHIYHTVAPWEHGKGNDLVKPMKRMFPREQFIVRNQDLSPRDFKDILPPIGVKNATLEKEKHLLRLDLISSSSVIKMESITDLKNRFLAADVKREGVLASGSAFNLMKVCKIELDSKSEERIKRVFKNDGSDTIFYLELLSFLRSVAVEKIAHGKRYEVSTTLQKLSKQSHNSKDISGKSYLTSPNGTDYTNPISINMQARTEVKRLAFAKRDQLLLKEMEKSFKGLRGDPWYVVQQFRNNLENKKGKEKVITTYQLKDMATRHQLPFNNALMEKIFDRLDPMNTGNIYWEECVEFLEKALPGYQDTSKPSKPPWETKKPLKPITVDLPIKESPMTKTSGRKNSKADTFPYSDFVSEKRYVDNNSREMPQNNRSEENYGRKEKKPRRPESRLEKYILLIKDLRKRADPETNLLDAEEARRLLQSYDVMFELGMPNKVINEIIERSDFDGTVDVNDVIGYVGGY